jgi:hypothetical protein
MHCGVGCVSGRGGPSQPDSSALHVAQMPSLQDSLKTASVHSLTHLDSSEVSNTEALRLGLMERCVLLDRGASLLMSRFSEETLDYCCFLPQSPPPCVSQGSLLDPFLVYTNFFASHLIPATHSRSSAAFTQGSLACLAGVRQCSMQILMAHSHRPCKHSALDAS